jgi:hypothetical protein
VSGDAGKLAQSGPSAVAVHNDGDVPRQPFGVNGFQQNGFFASGFDESLKFHASFSKIIYDNSVSYFHKD